MAHNFNVHDNRWGTAWTNVARTERFHGGEGGWVEIHLQARRQGNDQMQFRFRLVGHRRISTGNAWTLGVTINGVWHTRSHTTNNVMWELSEAGRTIGTYINITGLGNSQHINIGFAYVRFAPNNVSGQPFGIRHFPSYMTIRSGSRYIRVNNPPANPSNLSISANHTTRVTGQTVRISWTANNVSSISLNQGIGNVGTGNGHRDIVMNNVGTFTFTATFQPNAGATGGAQTRSVTVVVNPSVHPHAMRWTATDPIQVSAGVYWRWE